MLQKEKWDIVTLQQVSKFSFKPETYEPYFGNLYAYVKQYAPQAEIVVQMTWSYREDHEAFPGWDLKDQQEMYHKLYGAYTAIAAKYQCRLIPSGMAVHMARQQQPTPAPIIKYDMASFKHPNRPDEPEGYFIGCYFWRKEKDGSRSLGVDQIHLNDRGRYLQACVWYATLYGRPTSEISYLTKGLSPDDGAFLRQIAQQAVDAMKKDQLAGSVTTEQ